MEPTELKNLGFNKNEAVVFIALLRLGEATAGDLIKKTGLHRNIVYDNLEKLADKGLLTCIIKAGVHHYIIPPPSIIEEFIEEKQKTVQKLAKEITQQIKIDYLKPKTQLFQGTLGIREVVKDTLKIGRDYIVYGGPGASVEIMGEHFWKNYTLKRKEKRIRVRMIFNVELRSFGKTIENKYTKIKYLPKQFDSLTETTVYGDKVAIMVWTEKPITTLIEDKNVAQAYKKYFEVLWKIARE